MAHICEPERNDNERVGKLKAFSRRSGLVSIQAHAWIRLKHRERLSAIFEKAARDVYHQVTQQCQENFPAKIAMSFNVNKFAAHGATD